MLVSILFKIDCLFKALKSLIFRDSRVYVPRRRLCFLQKHMAGYRCWYVLSTEWVDEAHGPCWPPPPGAHSTVDAGRPAVVRSVWNFHGTALTLRLVFPKPEYFPLVGNSWGDAVCGGSRTVLDLEEGVLSLSADRPLALLCGSGRLLHFLSLCFLVCRWE